VNEWSEDRNFIRALNVVCSPRVEGGYSEDPDDKGNWTGGEVGKGELQGTKWGISAAAYPTSDIKNLRWNDAAAIYFRDYWLKGRCDRIPPRLGLALFDACVNHGVKKAVMLLQETIGEVVDGELGPNTAACAWRADPEDTIINFQAHRLEFYREMKTWPKYGKGWTRRALRVAVEAIR
jgi:lysozyme family protein